MNYTKLFYWLTVADNAKTFFVVFMSLFTAISVIATICYIFNSHTEGQGQTESDEENQKMARKWMWYSYPLMMLFWSLYIFTPSKKEALLIVAGGQTLNFLANDKSAKQIPSELSGFVLTELKHLAKEAKVDLGIATQKDKVLERAKEMTAQELMKEMRKDSTFAKIVLDK